MYVIVCQDMPLRHQAVQACHAGIAAGKDLIEVDNPYLVLLTIPTQHELIELSTSLTKAGVAHRVFHEADMGGRATALATGCVTEEQRQLFAGMPLYGARAKVAA